MSCDWKMEKDSNNKTNSMDDTSDFTGYKISVMKKVLNISPYINCVTIGPQSIMNKNDVDKENIEIEQNSCNVKSPQNSYTNPKQDIMSTSTGIIFSPEKIRVEKERQRKEEVMKKVQNRSKHMNENSRAIQEKLTNTLLSTVYERERENREKLQRIIAEEEQIAEQEEIKRRHEIVQRAQEQKEIFAREAKEYEQQVKQKEELMRAVIAQRIQFMAKYSDITALTKACKDKHALNILISTNMSKIKELCLQIETINKKIESGDLVITDVNAVEILVCHIDDMLNLFRTEIEKINAQYEAELARKEQTDNEVQTVAVTESSASDKAIPLQETDESDNIEKKEDQNSNVITNQEVAITPSMSNTPITPLASDSNLEEASKDSTQEKENNLYEYVDKESLQIYIRSRQFLAIYRQSYKGFLQSANTKKFRFECQKAINIPVNAISGTNEQHLRDKYDRLQNLLTGKSSPNVMQYSQGVIFCKDHLARKMISQGETLVSSKPEMAFPIAAIIVALWNEHEDFGELFLAHLHESCPFTVPIFLPQQEGQSNEDYYKSLGCKYSEDGTVEKQDKFFKRMSGLMRLYASVTVIGQRKGVIKTHPHGLQFAWRWLAAVLNTKPRADIRDLCATLILDMLEVAGNMLWTAYPKQFYKLLILMVEEYYPRVQNIVGPNAGPLVRLEEFLNNALTSSTIRPANGLLPPNFW